MGDRRINRYINKIYEIATRNRRKKRTGWILKHTTLKKCVFAVILVSVILMVLYWKHINTPYLAHFIQKNTRPEPNIRCGLMNGPRILKDHGHKTEAQLRSYPKVLVFVETAFSKLGRDIAELLVHTRIKYKVEVAGKSLPVLTNLDKGRYGVIVFENFSKYLEMDNWNRELLDKYCREYLVGMIGFIPSNEETYVGSQLKGFPLFIHTNLRLKDAALNPTSQILRLTRAGETAWGELPGNDWTVFQANHSTYEPLEWAHKNDYFKPTEGEIRTPLTTVLQDHGLFDNIQRVIFGSGLKFWLHRLLFLDSLSYLSHGQLSLSLDRMFLVDIDDIFVGEVGTRLKSDDVRALIDTQSRIQAMVPGFKFNLGFSGKYFHHGNSEEDEGDDVILENIDKFMWFSHMWNHLQPHLYDNLTYLMEDMMLNKNFAKQKGIPVDSGYSVAPHHSGVYPVHEILYTAWKKVWNIRVTSTEEYPHLRPARLRRGFIHRNIMVLPRQTCGLFTHTMMIDKYPGGRMKLDESIQGGELFQTIVYNPINIFMTHMSNYGNDRLGLYTFESVIKFIRCWTNIHLTSAPPLQIAEAYFKLYPGEVDPVWGNPCLDTRHQKIWSKNKSCESLPKFLVIGPQKTGTTALYTFLSLHPAIASNIPSTDTFEEIQFFNAHNYLRGLDWYMNFFPVDVNSTTKYYFEKSATYFDGELVPRRVHALLPYAKLITILISPAKRAYSWYQHIKAHGDPSANNYTFNQVITASDTAPKPLRDLRNRCLNPGKYAQHLERWLTYFAPQNLHIIDGEVLKSNPVEVMNEMQKFLKITPFMNYTEHLRFDSKKGFYCQVKNNRPKCLGRSKGRHYPPMDEKSQKFLQRYYVSHNTALVKMMKRIGIRTVPNWLKDDLSDNVAYCHIMRQESFIARPVNPQANSNCLSILSFWYTIGIFNRAKRGDLSEEDLAQPLTEHKSSYLGEKLAILWSKEVIRAKEKGKLARLHSVLYRCFQREIIGFSITAVILEMIVRISQPLFLKLLLRYYSSDNMEKLTNQTETSKYTYFTRMIFMYDANQGPISKNEAVFYTCGVIISSWLSVGIGHPYLMGIMHLGMKMRIACCSLIYRKALRIRLDFAGASMMGNIINLLSNDVNRFDNGIMFLPYTWLCPLQIAFITYFMYMEMGLAGVYGILSLISVIPIQLWLAIRVMTLRHKTALRTDERVRDTNEMLQAIQVLKMYTWEEVFMNIIYKSRAQEMQLVKQMGYIKGVLMSLIIFSFRFSIFVMTVAYVYMGGLVSAEKIFVITAFMLILRQTVTIYYPQTLAQGAELMVSLQRLEEFLRLPESSVGDPTPLKPKFREEIDKQQLETRRVSSFPEYGVVKTSGASVKINDDVVLQDITFEVDPGVLTVVIGPVGSGKSCLLHLLLGELSHFEGTVEVKGIISYASQEPWLFSGTIRQNILFGRKFDRRRYEEVCFACALNTDFTLLPQGDKTYVGEKGTSLSGGQRARVNLARAIYKEADIYLLDDPLSAVDTHVGKHLFEECVSGYLSDKIVILVTHQLQYLENVDQIILMKDGVIEAKNDYDHMKDAGLDFSLLMIEQLTMTDERIERRHREKKSSLLKIVADISRRSIAYSTFIDKDNQMPAIKKISKEVHKSGGVGSAVYKEYMKAASNSGGIFLMFLLFFSTQIVASAADYYLSMWVNHEEGQVKTGDVSSTTRKTYIYVYSCIITVCIVISLLRSIHFFVLCTRASLNLHNNMFRGVVETRMSFFYSHNSGEILNTFSKDLGSIDEVLPMALIDTMQIFLNLFGVILVLGIINPYLMIPTVLILIIFHFMRNFYLRISNNIKRLEDVTKSPVFAHINSTLQGITTIRSNGAEQILTTEFDKHQDIHSSAWFTYIATARAFGYWLDLICIVYIAFVSFSFLFMSNQGSFVGLAITQTISLTGLFQWGLRQSVEVENQMVSVDRILDYVKLEPEPNLKSSPAEPPPPDWPTTGKIEYSHAFMTYGPQGAHVLKDVTFIIQDKEKIGIVGRTGAGKSSLIATLFRLAYFYGEVRIDNLDISQLSLHDLRRKISIIPQEPVLFNGTLQYNLDPFSEFDTNWIMKVLIDLENKDALSHGKDCLHHMIIEGGINVSIGQRQIICLARALLKNNKIIVMDEATANIDAKTDKFIQSIIRTKFSNCTVLTIAHRLHTIMDSDKVLVMDAGQVAEFDHPHILLQDPEGIFSGMVEKTGKHMAENLRKIAKQTFEAQTKTE